MPFANPLNHRSSRAIRASAVLVATAVMLGSLGGCCMPPMISTTNEGDPMTDSRKSNTVDPYSVEALHWLLGEWTGPAGDGAAITEHYTLVEGGSIRGTSSVVHGGQVVHSEVIDIKSGPNGRAIYHAHPKGVPSHEFKITSHENQRVVFEDPNHDFPAWMCYTRVGNSLTINLRGAGDKASTTMDFALTLKSPAAK